MKGCHSTIDSPECVRRVTPPTTTIANNIAQHASNQMAIARDAWADTGWLFGARSNNRNIGLRFTRCTVHTKRPFK